MRRRQEQTGAANPTPTKPSQIFFDQRWDDCGGIGRFSRNLRRELIRRWQYEFQPVDCAGSPVDPIDPWRLGRYLKRQKATLYVTPGYNVALWPGCPTVSTVHDLIHLSTHSVPNLPRDLYYRMLVRPAIRRNDRTLTVSGFSQRQIAAFAGVSSEKVVVVGNGVDSVFRTGTANSASTPVTYLLYVGCDKPHKNLPVLLQAAAPLLADRSVRLKLVTKPRQPLVDLIWQYQLQDHVDVVDRASETQLAELYRGAIATVQPSLIEGFGLPIVEAMASGCPVIGSRGTATGEVIGDAGLTFDPANAGSLREAMRKMLDCPQTRRRCRAAGLKRAEQYRWSEVADRTHAALMRVLGDIGRVRRAA